MKSFDDLFYDAHEHSGRMRLERIFNAMGKSFLDPKEKHLWTVLMKNGISPDDKEVLDFFYRKRVISPKLQRFTPRKTDEYEFCEVLRPNKLLLNPLDFENSSYAQEFNMNRLIDWYMYETANNNSLVQENIGVERFDLLDSYCKLRSHLGPLKIDIDGNVFNTEDGNHRLLALIINEFIYFQKLQNSPEFKKLSTNERSKFLDEKRYERSRLFDVDLPIKKELAIMLKREEQRINSLEKDDAKRIVPNLACRFRERTLPNEREAWQVAFYQQGANRYTYNFNGEHFSGNEEQIINFLKLKRHSTEPEMQWSSCGVAGIEKDGTTTFYKSRNNYITKTKFRAKQIKNFEGRDAEYTKFLTIEDLDGKTFDIEIPAMHIEDPTMALDLAKLLRNVFVCEEDEFVLTNKVENKDYIEILYEDVVEVLNGKEYLNIPEIKYANLTKDEYERLKTILTEIEYDLTQANTVGD